MILSFTSLRHEWLAAGGSPRLADTMAAIAKAESAGDNAQHNAKDPFGGSWCAWQINGVHPFFPSALTHDPYLCALAAVYVKHKQGLNAWSTYRYGQYRAFLPQHHAFPALAKTHRHAKPHAHAHHAAYGRPMQIDLAPGAAVNHILISFIFAVGFFALWNGLRHVKSLFVAALREDAAAHQRAARHRRYRDNTALRRRTMSRASRQIALM